MTSGRTTPLDVKVMTFNIRYDNPSDGENCWEKRKGFACDVVRDYSPDILSLQEANPHQLDFMVESLADYAAVGMGRDGGREGEHSSILYRKGRFTLVSSGTFWLSETPEKPSRDWGSFCRRICTWAHFNDRRSGRSFYVYNTHLDHKSQLARDKGIQLVMSHAEERFPRDPLVLTGDLNSGEETSVIQFLKSSGTSASGQERLVDTFRVIHSDEKRVGTGNRFTGQEDGRKADYIFVTPGIRTLDAAIVRTQRDGRFPSDHFPVTATLSFAEEAVISIEKE